MITSDNGHTMSLQSIFGKEIQIVGGIEMLDFESN